MLRTHTCGELRKSDSKKNVVLCGWIDRIREHANLVFVDLRDRYGITQCVFPEKLVKDIKVLKKESTIKVKGTVKQKPEPNKKLATGDIEIAVESFDVLGSADTLPLDLENYSNMEEETRLKWRYLDLRRREMLNNIETRHKVVKIMRDYLDEQKFLEIETPMLAKSTPEGARDFLVPSRVKPGNFYALPQSPQLFKQLLMVSGFDRYFQVVRCFRDEDLRADRQPEFTQLDMEMSFIEEEDIFVLIENMYKRIWHHLLKQDIPAPFPRMTYQEAMDKYGKDAPDTRFELLLHDVSTIVKDAEFGVFSEAVKKGGVVKAINAKGCAAFSRKELKELEDLAKVYEAKGLVWVKFGEKIESPVLKYLSEKIVKDLQKALNAKQGDLLLLVADHKHFIVNTALAYIRLKLGDKLGLRKKDQWNFVWVTDFPLVEYDEDAKRHVAIHHPFTSPKDEDLDLLDTHPVQARAKAYDLVLNGIEIGGGSIRIHSSAVQKKMFQVLGITKEEAEEKFGFLLNAFKYGAPPHGGLAFGLDRVIAVMTGNESIREVIAFPKTKNAEDLMMGSPSDVDPKQLDELAIKKK